MEKSLSSVCIDESLQPLVWFGYYLLVKWASEGIKSIMNNKKKNYFPLYFSLTTVAILTFFAKYTYISSIIMGISIFAHEVLWKENKYAASIVFLFLGIAFTFSLIETTILHSIIGLTFVLLSFILIKNEKRINFFIRVLRSKKISFKSLDIVLFL
ncbi:hypothetical protein [Pleurocapsa sp. FMAR1]|uniref:hypothetical protein n=1 Tax=Pleurocapsa sp. FMAR1 TaxID=3040204 RepID=UPI0029C9A03B|nr:hypothetical protein [Pleurocapsa sp. FMAR1]